MRELSVRLLACCLMAVAVAFASGCSQMRTAGEGDGDARAFRRIESRLSQPGVIEGRGTVSFSRASEGIEIPFSMSISEDLVITVDAEISHFMIPFEGVSTLVSSEERTLVSTPIGMLDLARMGHPHSAVRAGLFALLGGGDGLLLWARKQGCGVGHEMECGDLSIRLKPDETGYFIESWEVKAADGTTFKASIYALEPGPDRLPRSISGTVLPDQIEVDLEFDEISRAGDYPGQ